ncbi:DUF3000 domain-containing protein [Gulosibacter bifidus]|uniref:DUF3000 domain-containing protein n=1 Tax=Gulosibacter bifidus TaxID=272239 RepID=A0ABW5RFF2_9MICO|nr:DUF3000 domain-containing protein [Gulosibacter bifidus]
MVVSLHPVPAEFNVATESIRALEYRSDLLVQEIRPPEGLAPHSYALTADVQQDESESAQLGTGRFILLHDESEPDAWRGPFRVVCFAQAPLETDIGNDGMLPEVAWSWLVDALDSAGADYRYASGTVTVVNSQGFGEIAEQGEGSQIEMRASWTPQNLDIGGHVEAWTTLLCMLAGLPPVDTREVPVLRHPGQLHGLR